MLFLCYECSWDTVWYHSCFCKTLSMPELWWWIWGSRHPWTKSLNGSSLTRKTAHDLKMSLQKNMSRALENHSSSSNGRLRHSMTNATPRPLRKRWNKHVDQSAPRCRTNLDASSSTGQLNKGHEQHQIAILWSWEYRTRVIKVLACQKTAHY